MYKKSSVDFDNYIQSNSRHFEIKIKAADTEVHGDVLSAKFCGGSNGGSDIAIGTTVAQYVDLRIHSPSIPLDGRELAVSIIGNGEEIPMGLFTASKPKIDRDVYEITAYDRMMQTEKVFSSSLPDKTSTLDVLRQVETITGVTINTSGLSAIEMDRPDGYTCREVIGYVAELHGGFAVCDRSGVIQIKWYEDSDYPVPADRYFDGMEHNENPFTIQKITCSNTKDAEGNSVEITIGGGTSGLKFGNPFMTKGTLDKIGTKLIGFSYMPGKIEFLGDPRLDPWDVLTVADTAGKTYKIPVMSLILEYDGGLTDKVKAVGRTETEQAAATTGPITKEMERTYSKLVLIDKAVVNKLDADQAKITYATIQNLDAAKASISDLTAEQARFKTQITGDLQATNAKISNLDVSKVEASVANIKSLLAGNAAADQSSAIHLNAKNAVIDEAMFRQLIAQFITVNDLKASNLSTDHITIGSDAMTIHGSTQTFRDKAGHVRLQIGQDATGDFSFVLYDASGKGVLLDATGLKSSAISDGLIKDRMVAADAGIKGSKLDIDSVVDAVNGGSHTIKGTKVYLDGPAQTLDQVYTQIKSDADAQSQKVTQIQTGINGVKASMQELETKATDLRQTVQGHTTELTAIQGKIGAMITESEIQTLKAGGKTMYSALAQLEVDKDGMREHLRQLDTKYDDASGKYTSLNSKVSDYTAKVDQFGVSLHEAKDQIQGISSEIDSKIAQSTSGIVAEVAKTVVSQSTLTTRFTKVGNIYHFHAEVYQANKETTDQYEEKQFEWFLRTESGERFFARGKTADVQSDALGYGGTITCKLYIPVEYGLLTETGENLVDQSGARYIGRKA